MTAVVSRATLEWAKGLIPKEELDRAIRMGRVVVKNEPEEENDNKNS